MNRSPIWLNKGEVLAVFLENLAHRRTLFTRQGLCQGVLQYIAGIVEPGDIFRQLEVVVPAPDHAIVMFDDMVNRLIDKPIHTSRLSIGHILFQLGVQFSQRHQEFDVARGRFNRLHHVVGRALAAQIALPVARGGCFDGISQKMGWLCCQVGDHCFLAV